MEGEEEEEEKERKAEEEEGRWEGVTGAKVVTLIEKIGWMDSVEEGRNEISTAESAAALNHLSVLVTVFRIPIFPRG